MHLWALLLMSRITLLIMVGLRFATCHRILVPKSQVESIFQCFGLIFILMDPLGALLNTLGANLLKSVFLETPCRRKKCLKPKISPKNSCFGGNESQLHNFGGVWDPNFLRWPQFGGYPRKATCLSFKMSYVQGP